LLPEAEDERKAYVAALDTKLRSVLDAVASGAQPPTALQKAVTDAATKGLTATNSLTFREAAFEADERGKWTRVQASEQQLRLTLEGFDAGETTLDDLINAIIDAAVIGLRSWSTEFKTACARALAALEE
jgi:hypothetical protein